MNQSIIKLFVLCFITIFISLISGCGPSQKEYDALKKENEVLEAEVKNLKKEIDELKFGASRLLTKGKNLYENSKLDKAKKTFEKLLAKHPDSNESKEAKVYLKKVTLEIKKQKELEEAKKRKEELKRKRRIANATRKMRKKVDELEKITWYYDKSTPDYHRTWFYLYIGKRFYGKPWLRLKVEYCSDHWLFVNSFALYVDGDKYDRYYVKFERDNRGGSVWEWHDKEVTEDDMAMIRLIIACDKATIRFMGDKYYKNHVITKTEKQALQNVLDAYEALNESKESVLDYINK